MRFALSHSVTLSSPGFGRGLRQTNGFPMDLNSSSPGITTHMQDNNEDTGLRNGTRSCLYACQQAKLIFIYSTSSSSSFSEEEAGEKGAGLASSEEGQRAGCVGKEVGEDA